MNLKYCILFSCLLGSVNVIIAQNQRFELSLEYSPNYSILTNAFVPEKYKLSHNVFLKTTYLYKDKLHLIFGFGYLNTGEKEVSEIGGQMGIEKISLIHNYNYLVLSTGLKFKMNSLFIIPEIGFGVHLSHITSAIINYSNGIEDIKKEEEKLPEGSFSKLTLPLFLSIGKEIKFRSFSVLVGIKSYISINEVVSGVPRTNHFYGIGLLGGIAF